MSYSQTVTLLDSGSWDRPATWNAADCKIECWGAGGSGGLLTDDRGTSGILGVPGAGGDYASISNVELPAAVNYSAGQPVESDGQQPGPGGDSYVSAPNDGVFVLARGGNSLTPSSVGSTVYLGGQVTENLAVGGGGAAGPHGNGAAAATETGGAGDNGSGGAGGAIDANGADNANGGGGSGLSDDTPAVYGGFPGGGSGVTTGVPMGPSIGGAGKIVLSWNPA